MIRYAQINKNGDVISDSWLLEEISASLQYCMIRVPEHFDLSNKRWDGEKWIIKPDVPDTELPTPTPTPPLNSQLDNIEQKLTYIENKIGTNTELEEFYHNVMNEVNT